MIVTRLGFPIRDEARLGFHIPTIWTRLDFWSDLELLWSCWRKWVLTPEDSSSKYTLFGIHRIWCGGERRGATATGGVVLTGFGKAPLWVLMVGCTGGVFWLGWVLTVQSWSTPGLPDWTWVHLLRNSSFQPLVCSVCARNSQLIKHLVATKVNPCFESYPLRSVHTLSDFDLGLEV